VAAVLTLRKGRISSSVERSIAVFCSTSGGVITTIQQWYRDQGGQGVPPVVHQYALTSLAWLKRPAVVRGIKTYELAASCAAALRPTRETWAKFLDNLRRLRADRVISDDETVAIVASELIDPLLARLDDEMEPDADTIGEAIERVRGGYRAEAQTAAEEMIRRVQLSAEEAVRQAQSTAAISTQAAAVAQDRQARLEARARSQADRIASLVSGFLYLVVAVILVASVVVQVPGVLDRAHGPWRILGIFVLIMALAVGTYSQIYGPSMREIRGRLHEALVNDLGRRLYGLDWETEGTRVTSREGEDR
jgi:hypothetical protein